MKPSEQNESFELVDLKSGHKSIRLTNTLQTFHPGIGPQAEAKILYVEGQKLKERCSKPGKFIIWDVGLGAAANAICAIEALQDCESEVEIHSFEQTLGPLNFALTHAEELKYLLPHHQIIQTLIQEQSVKIHPRLNWVLHLGDFRKVMTDVSIPCPDAIFYDPYSISVNPELWTIELFQQIRSRLDDSKNCVWTNYTRSTALRATLLLAGFYVGYGPTIGDKEESTIASNQFEMIEKPLDERWLKRVKASQNANPIRGCQPSYGPISEEDYRLLLTQKQFQHPTR
jgi:tRNA U34 5-methylaminomethyl-2-thiouridine-forming methyltransferase MnmC